MSAPRYFHDAARRGVNDETERDLLAERDDDVGDELAARADGFWRLNMKPEPYYVAEVKHLGIFKWRWIVTERVQFPLTPTQRCSHQDTTIIYGVRRTRRRAEQVAAVMRDGFIAAPLPERLR